MDGGSNFENSLHDSQSVRVDRKKKKKEKEKKNNIQDLYFK